MLLVATQTPRERAGWALGVLSTGALTGNLIGPLVGGVLPNLIGIRNTFFVSGRRMPTRRLNVRSACSGRSNDRPLGAFDG